MGWFNLVERFNRTLTDMLAKKVEKGGRDWDTHLPYVLFAYRASLQEPTGESPFFLLYGRDPRLPTELRLDQPATREVLDLDTYKGEVAARMQDAWSLAQTQVKKAQKRQKDTFDRQAKPPSYSVGERVFVYMPGAKATKAYKFARRFYGPYRVVTLYDTGVEVCPVDRPQEIPIRVSLTESDDCQEQIPDTFWPWKSRPKRIPAKKAAHTPGDEDPLLDPESSDAQGSATAVARPEIWKGRLRSSCRSAEDTLPKDGDV